MNIRSITVQHDPAEDRIILFARQADTEQTLLLTRRLTQGLLAALGKQIQHTQGDQRLAQAGLQDELLSMKHSRALNHVREAQTDRPDLGAALKRLPTRLLTSIEIRDQGLTRLLVFGDASGEVASIAFDAAQIHWFVGRLATHSHNAGWGNPMPIPGWLDQSAGAKGVVGQDTFRSIH